jgi:glycosyltransferase involved in cell wall biosynthesis
MRRIDCPQMKVIRISGNVGPAEARNEGVRATTAPLIAFLDDDDEWMPDKLVAHLEFLARRRYNLVFSTVQRIDAQGRNIAGDRPIPAESLSWPGILFCDPVVTPSAVVIRREAFLTVGGFCKELRLPEDWDLCARIARMGTIGCISRPLVRYRVHSRQMASGRTSGWVRKQTLSALEHLTCQLSQEQRDFVINAYAYGGAWRSLAALNLRTAWDLATSSGAVDLPLLLRRLLLGVCSKMVPQTSSYLNRYELKRSIRRFLDLEQIAADHS